MIDTVKEKRIVYVDGSGRLRSTDECEWTYDRKRTCCFTGHRPEKLPGNASGDSLGYMNMKSTAALHIYGLTERGYDTFIIGMSRGFDLEMGGLLLSDPRFSRNMKLICAIPYPNQIREMRNEREYNLYNRLIEEAETVAVCSECYFDGCYRIRNLFMVNYSSAVIGYMKSRKLRSGTMQTVNMAERAGLEMHIMYGSENPQFTMADLW